MENGSTSISTSLRTRLERKIDARVESNLVAGSGYILRASQGKGSILIDKWRGDNIKSALIIIITITITITITIVLPLAKISLHS